MKAKISITIEYELEPYYYPDGATPQEMVDIDVKNFDSNPDTLYEIMIGKNYSISGVVVEV